VRRTVLGLSVVAALAALVGLAAPGAAVFEDQFTWPMDGSVTSDHWDCRDGCERYHRAVDIADGCGTDIYAARAGTASTHYDADGYGNYVIVDHGDGWSTLYAHLDEVQVADGDSVTRDTVLGTEGETGSATGCHVHFEARQDDQGEHVKRFLPAGEGDEVTAGEPVGAGHRVLEATSSTTLLDGPDVDDVPGEGDASVAGADAGDRFVAYASWTNADGETWHATFVDGRVGWLDDADATTVSDTTARIRVDTALNVREGPGTGHEAVGQVHGVQAYPVLDDDVDGDGDPWLSIPHADAEGGTGWVHADWVRPTAIGADGPLDGDELFLDPGHGGEDPGAQAGGTDEKDVVLDVALEARDRLVADGATVVLPRVTDKDVALDARTDAANAYQVDRFVSVHANSCGDCGADGTETYYHDSLDDTSTAADLAEELQAAVVDEAGTSDRGVKQENFHVLRESDMPAALVETAFLDDDGDREKLTSDDGQASFAEGIRVGVREHLDAGAPGDPDPVDTLDEGFEDPLANWTRTDAGGPASWTRTTDRAREGSSSIVVAGYGADEDDRLVTPPVNLTGDEAPRLVLASWMEGERACGLFGCTVYDHGTIEVTADGGDTWDTLEDEHWTTDGWATLAYDLTSYAGEIVRIRFTFTSDGATHNEGWYLDHVELYDPTPRLDAGFEDGLGDWSTTDAGGPASWTRTTDRAREDSWSVALAGYGADEDDRLVSPTVDLTDRRAPELELGSWMEGERACGLFGCTVYDHGTIEVTADGGDTWDTLEDEHWTTDGWATLAYDLTPYAGETVELRFAFASDGATHNEGWYVDAVTVR
jgi:N-acetylmuramoyl-L-alanine amidase